MRERLPLNSIRARMTLAFALQTVALMLLVCGGLLLYLFYSALHTAQSTLHTAAERVRGELVSTAIENSFNEYIRENGDSLKTDDVALLLADAQGRVTLRSQNAGPRWPRQQADGWRTEEFSVGANTVVVGYYWEKTEKVLKREAVVLLALSLCVVLASVFGAWWLVGRTLSPIDRLSQQARVSVSNDSLHLRLDAPSQDAEVTELVATLNALLERVGKTAEAKGRFYAAASHELRTPLQALSGHLEVALSRERTLEEYRETTAEASRQTQRLTALVQGLLLLNQLDRPTPETLPAEPVEIAQISARFLTQFAPLIARRQLQISTEGLAAVELTAPPQHIEMLVRNLLENALKYASSGGEVRLSLRSSPEGLLLEIFNTFPAQHRLDTNALFEPFYRPDEARTSEAGGNGLGLALCKAIAVANGWKITLNQNDEGVSARVLFA